MVDVDYAAGMTEFGHGHYGRRGASATRSVTLDADAIRRVSYNVGCVAAITATGLQLDAPLLGGAPASGARVQKVWHSWTAMETAFCRSGRRCLRWKKPAADECTSTIRGCRRRRRRKRRWRSWQSGVSTTLLHAEFEAMASTDANDGQSVVCYRSYVPAAGAPAY